MHDNLLCSLPDTFVVGGRNGRFGELHVCRFHHRVPSRSSKRIDDLQEHLIALFTSRTVIHNDHTHCFGRDVFHQLYPAPSKVRWMIQSKLSVITVGLALMHERINVKGKTTGRAIAKDRIPNLVGTAKLAVESIAIIDRISEWR